MANWVRYSMWDRWRELTRFRVACEMALASYKIYVTGFPVSADAPLIIRDPSADSNFRCDLDEFKRTLDDEAALYRILFPSYVGLVEDLGRELVERLIFDKGLPRSAFPGLASTGDLADAAEMYITGVAIEVWGDAILVAGNRDWSSIKGGKRAVVQAITVRNLLAHGLPAFNQKAVNRIAAAAGRRIALEPGDPVSLNKKKFASYTSTLRTFARLLADAVSKLPDAS